MAIAKITEVQRNAVCVEGLNDVPGLDTRALQQRFDGLGNLAIDKINEMIDVINSLSSKTIVADKDGVVKDVNTVVTENTTNIANITTQVSELTNLINNKIVSVEELPSEPQEGVIYMIQGEVTVE